MTNTYIYHSTRDQNRSVAEVEALVETYRSNGAEVTYRLFRFGEHVTVTATGVPSALRFLTEQFGRSFETQVRL
jgi:predicted esterase